MSHQSTSRAHAADSVLPSFADTSALGAELKAELAAAGLDADAVLRHVRVALEEDLPLDPALGAAAGVDTTSVATLGAEQTAVAHFNAREAGVVSGLGLAALVFAEVMGDTVTVSNRLTDGSQVKAGDRVMTVAGPVRGLLTAERTALNFASHLSAVSTATSKWVEALEGTAAKVLDTRKTLPGWRALQKYAVRMGGGVNHRFSLSDMAMVKDNHVVAAGGVVPALEAVRRAFPGLPVEVEVTTLDELRELLDAGCDRVLLDNMSTETMREAVEITAGRTVLEASGGLTLERAREVALTGVDYISVGALTHSVVVFDLGLDLQED